MIDVVKSYVETPADEAAERARERIARHLASLGPGFETGLPLLLDFLGLAEAGAEPPKVDPTARRERLEVLFRRLVRMAGSAQPAVILLEDLHLMDSGSESLIEVLVEALQGTKLLLIVNYRPGYAAPWMHGGHYDQISLSPLRVPAADLLAARLLGVEESVMPLFPLIADPAPGNPLFIEELVRKFEESGHLAGERGAYRLLPPPDLRMV